MPRLFNFLPVFLIRKIIEFTKVNAHLFTTENYFFFNRRCYNTKNRLFIFLRAAVLLSQVKRLENGLEMPENGFSSKLDCFIGRKSQSPALVISFHMNTEPHKKNMKTKTMCFCIAKKSFIQYYLYNLFLISSPASRDVFMLERHAFPCNIECQR